MNETVIPAQAAPDLQTAIRALPDNGPGHEAEFIGFYAVSPRRRRASSSASPSPRRR
jgi:hypothetical protein